MNNLESRSRRHPDLYFRMLFRSRLHLHFRSSPDARLPATSRRGPVGGAGKAPDGNLGLDANQKRQVHALLPGKFGAAKRIAEGNPAPGPGAEPAIARQLSSDHSRSLPTSGPGRKRFHQISVEKCANTGAQLPPRQSGAEKPAASRVQPAASRGDQFRRTAVTTGKPEASIHVGVSLVSCR